MGMSKGKGAEPPHQEAAARAESEPMRGRKPYEKPAFRYERVFETMALSCGKISPTQSHCRFNQKTS